MSRYFTRRATSATLYVEDEFFRPESRPIPHITVDSHEAVDTDLITITGESIMRSPSPMGFGKDSEW